MTEEPTLLGIYLVTCHFLKGHIEWSLPVVYHIRNDAGMCFNLLLAPFINPSWSSKPTTQLLLSQGSKGALSVLPKAGLGSQEL